MVPSSHPHMSTHWDVQWSWQNHFHFENDNASLGMQLKKRAATKSPIYDLKSFEFTAICVQHWLTSQNLVFLSAAFAFIVLKEDAGDSEVVMSELRSMVATKIAKYAVPDQILVSALLPLVQLHCSSYTFFSTSHNSHHSKTSTSCLVSWVVDEGGRWLCFQKKMERGRET